ncbi:hypothetical protein MHK_007215 [Candidatus Magnetomorum sp. HK-1]|nr:hypothetical protein MHK_007215 [Candidatus Magnetomorum sp. HK-1]
MSTAFFYQLLSFRSKDLKSIVTEVPLCYIPSMIKSFKDKDTIKVFNSKRIKKINAYEVFFEGYSPLVRSCSLSNESVVSNIICNKK